MSDTKTRRDSSIRRSVTFLLHNLNVTLNSRDLLWISLLVRLIWKEKRHSVPCAFPSINWAGTLQISVDVHIKMRGSVAGGHSTCHMLLHSKVKCVAFVSLHGCDSQRSVCPSCLLFVYTTHFSTSFTLALLFFLHAVPYTKCLSK